MDDAELRTAIQRLTVEAAQELRRLERKVVELQARVPPYYRCDWCRRSYGEPHMPGCPALKGIATTQSCPDPRHKDGCYRCTLTRIEHADTAVDHAFVARCNHPECKPRTAL
jgi:hypothetical protein